MGPYDEALTADGFDEALLGFGHQFAHAVAIYDRSKCLDILIARDGMTPEEAEEHFSFNVAGAYVGDHTPVFLEVTGWRALEETAYEQDAIADEDHAR